MRVARAVVAAANATLVVAAGPKRPKGLDDKAIIAERSVSCRDVTGTAPARRRLRRSPLLPIDEHGRNEAMRPERLREPRASRRDVIASGGRLIALVSGLALAGCGLGGQAYQPVSADVAATVEMTNGLSFSPVKLTVEVGDVIEWRNRSLFTHTVTADPKLAKDATHVELPKGARPFDSGDVPPGEIFRLALEVPGRYRYFCIPHEGKGMLGEIDVKPTT
ncbi:MAG: plastocyanin/azurin family copper-binding protein [Acidimicrobiia bacterium]